MTTVNLKKIKNQNKLYDNILETCYNVKNNAMKIKELFDEVKPYLVIGVTSSKKDGVKYLNIYYFDKDLNLHMRKVERGEGNIIYVDKKYKRYKYLYDDSNKYIRQEVTKSSIANLPPEERNKRLYYYDVTRTKLIIHEKLVAQNIKDLGFEIPAMYIRNCLESFVKLNKEERTFDRYISMIKSIHDKYAVIGSSIAKIHIPGMRPCDEYDEYENIRVIFDLLHCGRTYEEQKEYISSNLPLFKSLALDTLNSSDGFRKYELPLGCYELSRIWFNRDNTLEFVFDIKKEIREALEAEEEED